MKPVFSSVVVFIASTAVATNTGTTCGSIPSPSIPGGSVLSFSSNSQANYTVQAGIQWPQSSNLSFCNFTVVYTHPGDNDIITTTVWLPTSWNGRFQAIGGGGFSAGGGEDSLGLPVSQGYSASTTDGGNIGANFNVGSNALLPNGSVNWAVVEDFSYRALHDMAIIAKDVAKSYYGTAPKYSYWNGCSTGGREGYTEAQRYPEDYDGIMANAPAINMVKVGLALQWPYVVMQNEHIAPPQCVFDAFILAAINQCDGLDGVKDGVISDINDCHFDPYSFVGKKIACNQTGTEITINKAHATVYYKILDGPRTFQGKRLWYGYNPGTGLQDLFPGIVQVTTLANGTTVASPEQLSDSFIRYLLYRDPNHDTSTMTYQQYFDLFSQALDQFETVLGTDNPDLSAFKKAGGKLLTWHGLSDNILFSDGTIQYRERVEALMGGSSKVDDFYRLFLAPGVSHCIGGVGAMPNNAFQTLVDWVEKGVAPEKLSAVSSSGLQRDLCKYPLVSKYDGHGNPNLTSSYACATHFGKPV
ncbi:putative feruloyl esterase [Tricladium varicosporioides]|nr:putative feruloyl esterase [Hymenoscyphus varicosporioides]